MVRSKKLNKDERRRRMFESFNFNSTEAAAQMRELDEKASWLLGFNLLEMDRRESDPDYDPAKDPTCVPVTIKNNK